MAQPRSRRPSCTLLILAIIACLAVALMATAGLWLLAQTEATFGRAAPGLSLVQRLRLSVGLLWQAGDLTSAIDPLGPPQSFRIDLGEGPPAIAARLESARLIPDAGAFTNYLQYAGLDTTLQAGNYDLSPAMSPLEIAHALQDATPKEVTLSILEGWRLEEIAATLPSSGLEITPQEFIDAAYSIPEDFNFLEHRTGENSLEGFLFPGVYEIPREATASQVINVLLDNFKTHLTPQIQAGFDRQGVSIFTGVTIASIVQREAVVTEEMPLLASVFLNRLAIGMPLEADPTVQYALGYNQTQKTWWTNPLSAQDLKTDSPYNTYMNPGLPPGPIANPGLNALQAVAFPAQTPYYYFRAACDSTGNHVFAKNYQEHLQNACP